MSTYYQLLTAVQSSLRSLEALSGVTVTIRKRLKVLDGDKLPIVIVAPDARGEKRAYDTFPGPGVMQKAGVVWEYPVLVGYYAENLGQVQTGIDQMMTVHEAMRDQLYQLEPVLPATVSLKQPYDVEIEPDAVIEPDVGNRTEVDATGFRLTYTVSEQRTS